MPVPRHQSGAGRRPGSAVEDPYRHAVGDGDRSGEFVVAGVQYETVGAALGLGKDGGIIVLRGKNHIARMLQLESAGARGFDACLAEEALALAAHFGSPKRISPEAAKDKNARGSRASPELQPESDLPGTPPRSPL